MARPALLRIDPFVATMLGVVLFAALLPWVGASKGPLRLGIVTQWGVALLFFLHGANLSLAQLWTGVRNWRLHVLVQSATFLFYPLIGFAILLLAPQIGVPATLVTGLFYLTALPSTIASSIAMTAMARGNVAGALFNATLSALIGMVVTPLLVRAGLHAGDLALPPLGTTFLKIGTLLLLPFVLGQVARPVVGGWLKRHKRPVYIVDRGTILLIILAAFSDATMEGIWHRFPPLALLALGLATAALLALALGAMRIAARALRLPPADEAAALFCGSQKSLANGVPMALAIFGPTPNLGIYLLPLLLYQQLQLIVSAVIARRYGEAAG
jgi:sodium/bile acid cotransporter 7